MSAGSNIDLVVDQIYRGSRKGNASDDPLPKLLGVDSGAGFRHLGKRPETQTLKLLVLKSSLKEPDWPDSLDAETGIFTYYGDRRSPGDIHDTPRLGNRILANLFEARHHNDALRSFPPIFIFGNTGVYRDVRFFGLAVPGAEGMNADEDLVAIWKSSGPDNVRFQNYRARFTILDVPILDRRWIADIQAGNAVESDYAPSIWIDWLERRNYTPLQAPRAIETRSKEEQLPKNTVEKRVIKQIRQHFRDDPYAFEHCALQLAKLMMPNIVSANVTRPWRDGGRDAVGEYRIGNGPSAIRVDFALEAKFYSSSTGVGVKDLSRLISRLRHRQFGIIVTTSYVSSQAYKELKDDGHPVIVICGHDIARLLTEKIGDNKSIDLWLDSIRKKSS